MYKQKVKKHSKVMKVLFVFLIIAILATSIFVYRVFPEITDASTNNINNTNWYLILVNSNNEIPDNYNIDLTELRRGESVDSRIYPDLQDMFDNARAEGVYPEVVSGYRTSEKQQSLLDERIEAYKAEGYSASEAEKLAKQWVAVPGTSEHQLGLAVDINADSSGKSTNQDVYDWLYENAYKYGFILRYPSDKTHITGTSYEPWHYRYVGKEVSKEIYTQSLCLEEYLENK